MRYLIALSFFMLFACNDSTGQLTDPETEHVMREDSLWHERNTFLSDQTFKDQVFQNAEFQKYAGLWTCVKTKRNRDGKLLEPKYDDLLLADGKAWMLDYPCSWNMQGYAEDVHFRNDSIFFSTENRVYIEKKKIEFSGDTLIIAGDGYGDESDFYLQKPYDSLTLADLKERGFNDKCFRGKWRLTSIDNGASDEWVIQDGFLDHVPRMLNFSKINFKVEGIYLVHAKNAEVKFEIVQFDRWHSEYDGERAWLYIKELDEINGIEYYYAYEPVSL